MQTLKLTNFRFANDFMQNMGKYFTKDENEYGFDLINAGHVMYHVRPDIFEHVVKECILDNLSAKGVAIFTILGEYGLAYDLLTHFALKLGIEKLEFISEIQRICDKYEDEFKYELFNDDSMIHELDIECALEDHVYWVLSLLAARSMREITDEKPLFSNTEMRERAFQLFEETGVFTDSEKKFVKIWEPQSHIFIRRK